MSAIALALTAAAVCMLLRCEPSMHMTGFSPALRVVFVAAVPAMACGESGSPFARRLGPKPRPGHMHGGMEPLAGDAYVAVEARTSMATSDTDLEGQPEALDTRKVSRTTADFSDRAALHLHAYGAAGHGRTLLHGCHKRRCPPPCPRCRFEGSRRLEGHCKKNGRLFICKRRDPDKVNRSPNLGGAIRRPSNPGAIPGVDAPAPPDPLGSPPNPTTPTPGLNGPPRPGGSVPLPPGGLRGPALPGGGFTLPSTPGVRGGPIGGFSGSLPGVPFQPEGFDSEALDLQLSNFPLSYTYEDESDVPVLKDVEEMDVPEQYVYELDPDDYELEPDDNSSPRIPSDFVISVASPQLFVSPSILAAGLGADSPAEGPSDGEDDDD